MDLESKKFVEDAIKIFKRIEDAESLLKNIYMEDDLKYSLPDYIKKDLQIFLGLERI